MRRNHVVRQLLAQRGLELRAQLSLLGVGQRLVGDDIADQLVVRGDHQRLAHTGLSQQARFDFTQLDTETSHLDLMVDSPHVLDHPIGAITCQVAGAVQAADAVSAEGIGNEAVGCQVRTLEITPRQQRAADHQLARDTYRHRVEVGIQQVNGSAIQHAANRHHRRQGFTALDIRGAVQGSGGHRGFGRPVGVEQPHLLQACCAPGIQPFRRHGFAANVQLAQAPVITWAEVCKVAHQSQPIGRGQVDHGNIVFNQLLVEGVAVPQFATAYHHRSTAAQRRVELLDKTVEVEGAKLQHAVMGLQRKQLGEDLHMPGQGREVDAHAFWPAGGAGREHHVGQVGRVCPRHGVFSAVIGQPVCAGLQAHKRQARADRQMLHQRLLGQQQLQTAVLDHALQAFGRVFRVQRHIGATALEHRQQADDHFQGTVHRNAHQRVGADAQRDQAMGQAVGAQVEVGVGHTLLIQDQRDVLRVQRGLLFEALQYACLGRLSDIAWVPVLQHAGVFRIQQQGDGAHGLLGRLDKLLQQALQVGANVLHSVGVELRTQVFQVQAQALAAVHGQCQRVVGALLMTDATEAQTALARLLQRLGHREVFEHHQRVE
ncbi:hypothetical protein ALP97_02048 [Pseudomonas salomonii]|uniref:Uncharacterized protein n=1 Tax=Pseudomonas salomonii TaxID=191391 RepID=A0A3M4QL22_9PSED|nr:hypothetical protein ALP97_02048 [Pseudomonas salomonii]